MMIKRVKVGVGRKLGEVVNGEWVEEDAIIKLNNHSNR